MPDVQATSNRSSTYLLSSPRAKKNKKTHKTKHNKPYQQTTNKTTIPFPFPFCFCLFFFFVNQQAKLLVYAPIVCRVHLAYLLRFCAELRDHAEVPTPRGSPCDVHLLSTFRRAFPKVFDSVIFFFFPFAGRRLPSAL